MFYLPRYFWKKFEGGRMMFCTKGMADPQTDEKEMKKRVGTLVDNYKRFKNKNNRYATKFLFFEVTNLMNAAAQMFLMDKFMGGRFFDYGLRLLAYFNFDGDQTLLVGRRHHVHYSDHVHSGRPNERGLSQDDQVRLPQPQLGRPDRCRRQTLTLY